MKKLLTALSILLLAVCCALLVTACEDTNGEHAHEYGEWTVTKEADCETEGVKVRTCSVCSHMDSEIIPSLGHDWTEYVHDDAADSHSRSCKREGCTKTESAKCQYESTVTAPTCKAEGFTEHVCTTCHHSYKDTPTEKRHVWGNWIADNDHTTHTRTCSVCGDSDVGECDMYPVSVTEPTCETEGFTLFRCMECKDEYHGDIKPEKGHLWLENVPVYDGVYPEGEEHAGEHRHRIVCEHDSSHVKYEPCTATSPNVVEPTCHSIGYTEYTCDKCNQVYTTDPQEMTSHNWADTWTAPSGLFPSNHTRKCQNDGCTATDIQPCTSTTNTIDPTCEADGYTEYTCPECHFYMKIPHANSKLGHDYKSLEHEKVGGVDKHRAQCKRCEEYSEYEDCEFVDNDTAPTCHSYGVDGKVCKKCMYSESIQLDKLAHKYGNYQLASSGHHYRICSVCREREDGECNYEVIENVPSDCETKGYIKQRCLECLYVNTQYDDNDTPGHTWENIQTDGDTHSATCSKCKKEASGKHVYTKDNYCDVCKQDGLIYKDMETYCIVWHGLNVRTAKKIVIPKLHDGKPVREIASRNDAVNGVSAGFCDNTTMTELVLPETLQKIGQGAFYGCTRLEKVTVENEEDDEYTPGLEIIESYAFYGCRSLISANNLPSTLKQIGQEAFRGCSALIEINLPETLDVLGRDAFTGTAYYNDRAHWSNDGLYISKHLIKADSDIDGTYEITDGTLTVGAGAFSGCRNLTTIVIPASVTHFDSDAFKDCSDLKEARYNGDFGSWVSIVFVNDYSSPLCYAARLHIEAHDEIEIPDGKTAIPAGTFRNTAITKITLPASITSIGDEAFAGCESLATVVIKDGSKIISIGKDTFKDSLYYNTPANWEGGVLYISDESGTAHYAVGTKDASGAINIREGTLAMAKQLFTGNTAITSVVTPDSIIEIGEYAFENCTALEEVTIGANCTRIGRYAFRGCTALARANFQNKTNWLYSAVEPAFRGVKDEDIASPEKMAEMLRTMIIFSKLSRIAA